MTLLHLLLDRLWPVAIAAWLVVADVSWRIRVWRYNRLMRRLVDRARADALGELPAHVVSHPYRGDMEKAVLPSHPLPKWWSHRAFRIRFTEPMRCPIPVPGTELGWRKTPCNTGVPKSIAFLWLLMPQTMRIVGPVKSLASSGVYAIELEVVGAANVLVLEQDFHEWLEPTPVTFRPSDGLRVYHMPSPSAYLE